jgi:hypothetical protein
LGRSNTGPIPARSWAVRTSLSFRPTQRRLDAGLRVRVGLDFTRATRVADNEHRNTKYEETGPFDADHSMASLPTM